MRSRSSSHSPSAWRWARSAWSCCACVLLWTCSQTPLPALTESETERQRLIESLATADQLLAELETLLPTLRSRSDELATRLGQAQRQLSQLSAKLTLWQEHSQELETSLTSSSAGLARLRGSLAELGLRYAALSRAWSEYRTEAVRQAAIREATIRRWRVATAAGAMAGLALGWLLGVLVHPG